MTRVIIFDLWHTLAEKEISMKKEITKKFNLKLDSDFTKHYERTVQLKKWKTEEDMAKAFFETVNIPITDKNISFFVEKLKQGMHTAKLYSWVPKTLTDLKKNNKLVLLSNTNIFECLKKDWKITHLFDKLFYSFETKLLKPNPQSFSNICSELNILTKDCLFLDDNKENVLAAEKLGITGIQFKDEVSLRKALFN